MAPAGALTSLISLAADAARHDRMLAYTYGDAAALAEITTAQQLILAPPDPDLAALGRLAVCEDRLFNRNKAVPIELPRVRHNLGQNHRAEASPTASPTPVRGPGHWARWPPALAGADRERALALAAEAEQATRGLPDTASRPKHWRLWPRRWREPTGSGPWLWPPRPADRPHDPWHIPADRGAGGGGGGAGRGPVVGAGRAGRSRDPGARASRPGRWAQWWRGWPWPTCGSRPSGPPARSPTHTGRPRRWAQWWKGLAAAQLWEQAERAAWGHPETAWQAWALRVVVEGLAAAQLWEQAERAARAIPDAIPAGPGARRGGRRAGRCDRERALALAAEAERAARAIPDAYQQAQALGAVAAALAGADRERALALAAEAEQIARAISHTSAQAEALEAVAGSLAAVELWDQAEQIARAIPYTGFQVRALGAVAAALAGADRDRALALAAEAEQIARAIPDRIGAVLAVARGGGRAGRGPALGAGRA